MDERREDNKAECEDKGPVGAFEREETNETDLGEVDPCKDLLEGAGVVQAACVALGRVYVKEVVTVGEVDEEKTQGGDTKDNGGDD